MMHNAVVHHAQRRCAPVVPAMPSERHERERAKRASTGTGYFQVRTKSKGFGLLRALAREARKRAEQTRNLCFRP